jgi:hypothetical protein
MKRAANSRQRRINRFQSIEGFAVIVLSPLAVRLWRKHPGGQPGVTHFSRYAKSGQKKIKPPTAPVGFRAEKRRLCVLPANRGRRFRAFDVKLHELLEAKRELSRDMLNGVGDITASDLRGHLRPETLTTAESGLHLTIRCSLSAGTVGATRGRMPELKKGCR